MTLNSDENVPFDESNIVVLEGMEAIRKRPALYVGGTDAKALHHLVFEVVDNSIQEALAGHGSTIGVTIRADGSVSVVDEGRGIEVGPHHCYPGLDILEVRLTKVHAC